MGKSTVHISGCWAANGQVCRHALAPVAPATGPSLPSVHRQWSQYLIVLGKIQNSGMSAGEALWSAVS